MQRLCDRLPVQSYSAGGFIFAGGAVRHSGSVLIMPDGVYAWPVHGAGDLAAAPSEADALAPLLAIATQIQFVLLGTGARQVFPTPQLRARFANAGLGLEAMDTPAACRTLHVLMAEERQFAAALIPAGAQPESDHVS
jgi:uncharacterized protein